MSCRAFVTLTVLLFCLQLKAQSVCTTPEALTATPQQMSQVLCEAAKDGRMQPSAESWLGMCGVGVKDAALALAKGLVDAAVMAGELSASGAKMAAQKTAKLWSSNSDAALAAESAAQGNVEYGKGWLAQAQDFALASRLLLTSWIDEIDRNARLVGMSLACLPWKFKVQLICQGVSQVVMDMAAIKAVATAGEKGLAAAKAVGEFMRKSGAIADMRGLSFAQRLSAAGEALKYQSSFQQVEKFGEAGNLVSRIDPITKQKMLHFEEIAVRDGRRVSVIRDIPLDAKTKAIDANFEYGKRLAKLTVERSKDEFLLFMDVNNLGKVNYFKSGTQAGDKYLERVGENIRKELRSEDRFFKNGGDELVVVLKSKDPQVVKGLIERIHKRMTEDEDLRKLFRSEIAAVAKKIKDANREMRGGFEILHPPNTEQQKALAAAASIRPSLSIGAARISGDFTNDLLRANRQADRVKALYKSDLGADVSKYKIEEVAAKTSRQRFNIQPRVLEPDEMVGAP